MAQAKDDIEPGKLRQLFVAIMVNVATLTYGISVGWQSPMMPVLQSKDPPVGEEPMTNEIASWLTAILCVAAAFTTLTVGKITERYGCKVTGCLAMVPCLVAWLVTMFATQQWHLLLARFFAGVSGAMTLFVIPRYVSEMCCDAIRGMLGSLLSLILNSGILFTYILGGMLSFHVFPIFAFVVPLVAFVIFLLVPESPMYLVRRRRLLEAMRSVRWFRAGHEPTVQREMLRLQVEAKELDSERSFRVSDLFRDRATIKGLVISMGLFGGQQLCGIFAMISYTETIFGISGSSLSPNASAIIVGVIQLVGSFLSTSLMERLGRRPLLLISSGGMCLCHYTLGLFCYAQMLRYDVNAVNWIPIVALSVYVIVYNLGFGPGPYVVSAEILSRDVYAPIMTLGLFTVWTTAFLVLKFFSSVVDLLGMHGCFFLLGTICIFLFAFIFVLIPETKGLPLRIILDKLNGRASREFDVKGRVSSKGSVQKNIPMPEQV
ncbi:facilitated trehalose transporter Tret1 [Megalopta genalis]|uniref:facilitated trehalose transporter Tret1 n=1 Tax=Megalopta genalis TaxID=115081 RepID=UPI003FD0B3E2